jgi:hypothetical protein
MAFVLGVAGYQWFYEEKKHTAAVLAPSSALSFRFDTEPASEIARLAWCYRDGGHSPLGGEG